MLDCHADRLLEVQALPQLLCIWSANNPVNDSLLLLLSIPAGPGRHHLFLFFLLVAFPPRFGLFPLALA